MGENYICLFILFSLTSSVCVANATHYQRLAILSWLSFALSGADKGVWSCTKQAEMLA